MLSRDCDVAVIGGGPAGLSAAITLAQNGVRVIVCEAKTYPHNKVCGEFLSPECGALLGALGLNDLAARFGAALIHHVRLTAAGVDWEARLPGVAYGLTRRTLDAALAVRAAHCGVTMCEGAPVKDVRGDLARGFTLTAANALTLRARMVIAAHGKRSALDRQLQRDFFNRPQPFVAFKAHVHGPAVPGRVELHSFPGGYCGLSAIENGLVNVCLLVRQPALRAVMARGADSAPQLVAWMRRHNPALQRWFAGADTCEAEWLTIAQVPFVEKQPVVAEMLMAGDAAGLIAPLAGAGIALALQSGQLAAEYAQLFLNGALSGADMLRQYAATWQREFGSRLRLGRWMQAAMLRPRLFALALHTLTALPALGHFFITQTRAPLTALPNPKPI